MGNEDTPEGRDEVEEASWGPSITRVGSGVWAVWHRLGDGLGVMPFPVWDVFVSTNPNSVHSGGTTEDIHCRSDSNGLDCALNLGLWVSASQYLV